MLWSSQDKPEWKLHPQEGVKETPWDPISCVLLWGQQFKMTSVNFLRIPFPTQHNTACLECRSQETEAGGSHKFKVSLVCTERPCVKKHHLIKPFSAFISVPLGQSLWEESNPADYLDTHYLLLTGDRPSPVRSRARGKPAYHNTIFTYLHVAV